MRGVACVEEEDHLIYVVVELRYISKHNSMSNMHVVDLVKAYDVIESFQSIYQMS